MKNIIGEFEKIKTKDVIPFLAEKSRTNKTFAILMIALSALFIFLGGKSFGEFLYYLLN
ncbi:hypothetical protein [Chryseobacterium sp. NFX27]|uniref:hypothetical protein n=1 Tax=Chryseobacterium sp. NFX27 TaxID=2819618 RepID=UPI003CE6EA96